VELLLVLGGDPAFNAPADLPFAQTLARVPLRVHLTLHANDTSMLCHWVVPEAHYLESWSDVRAFDGTASIVQPLIAPRYGGRAAQELLAVLGQTPERSGHDLVQEYWRARRRSDFDGAWRSWLEAGVVAGSEAPRRSLLPRTAPAPAPAATGLE